MPAAKTDKDSSFVSYAQLCEDVVLFRALKNIEEGFYLDVGAYDPASASITKAFYDRGWHGINIEPVDTWFAKLAQARTRDINLKVAAGSSHGTLRFFEIHETGLSTANVEFARNHERAGYKVKETEVEVTTIDAICSEYKPSAIHFLKIDVEGLEKEVLEGIDFKSTRPWIIVAEATMPLSHVETYHEWEDLLTSSGYSFVRTDGLNRFYCADEHSDLVATLQEPLETFEFTRVEE